MYQLKLSKQVLQQIEQLPGNIRQRVRRIIAELVYHPRPTSAKKMEDDLEGYYRIRLDSYRIIYKVDDEVVVVEVIRVAKRTSKTYEELN